MRKSALYSFGLVVLALAALGLIVLCSASQANGIRLYRDAYHFVKYQAVFLGVGAALATVVALVDYRLWRNHPALTVTMVIAVLALLVLALPPFGHKVNGSYRWIRLGPVNIQPSEFAKIAMVIAMAVWMDLQKWRVELFVRGAVIPAALIGILAFPILREPDFGSVMVVGCAGFLVMFIAGTRFLHLLPFFLLGLGGLVAKVAANANRMARIAAFLGIKIEVGAGATIVDAAADRAAYQARMALVAIKNGGLWGVGLGQSMQKQYYLPEAHTDFIFAIGAEELGLGFSAFTVILFLLFLVFAVAIARKASDRFGRYLVIGMTFLVFFQAMFNLGVVCEALPTKGMALPFFSYGGTNMLSAFFAVGTILSVGIHSYRDQKRVIKRNVFV